MDNDFFVKRRDFNQIKMLEKNEDVKKRNKKWINGSNILFWNFLKQLIKKKNTAWLIININKFQNQPYVPEHISIGFSINSVQHRFKAASDLGQVKYILP